MYNLAINKKTWLGETSLSNRPLTTPGHHIVSECMTPRDYADDVSSDTREKNAVAYCCGSESTKLGVKRNETVSESNDTHC